jgi:hypothetical protein
MNCSIHRSDGYEPATSPVYGSSCVSPQVNDAAFTSYAFTFHYPPVGDAQYLKTASW